MPSTKHGVAGSAAHVRHAKAKVSAKKVEIDDQQAEHCCDANPCSHCASCGSCASMAAVAEVSAPVHLLAVSVLPDPGYPRAEFLRSGQERPPRSC